MQTITHVGYLATIIGKVIIGAVVALVVGGVGGGFAIANTMDGNGNSANATNKTQASVAPTTDAKEGLCANEARS